VIKSLQRVTITPRQVNMADIKRTRSKSQGAVVAVDRANARATNGHVPGCAPHSGASQSSGPKPSVVPEVRASVCTPHVDVVELLFFAYRDFTAAADQILAAYGLGRAHHRVLHFVHRNPGLRVADLLDLLRITKQSLARVLKQLVDEGWIAQEATVHDRRVRRLYVTGQGRTLAERLIDMQTSRIAGALPGGDATSIRQFLSAMVAEENVDAVADLVRGDAASTMLDNSTGKSTAKSTR
jgi:DNA-binding MarR family transcriptional regulator